MTRPSWSTKRRRSWSKPICSIVMPTVFSPAWSAVSRRYATVIHSSPEVSASEWARCSTGPIRRAFLRQAATSRSCSEFHWSRSGWTSCTQYHWATEDSISPVGVSALYSYSWAGPWPS